MLDLEGLCYPPEALFDAVREAFEADGIDSEQVEHVFGWREPPQHRLARCRIVWVPGDDQTEELGTVSDGIRKASANPRAIGQLQEFATVHLEAWESSEPENERLQYRAARALFDAWWRAVYRSPIGVVTLARVSYVNPKMERRYGVTIRALIEVQAPIPDIPLTAVVDAGAEITDSLLDCDEVVAIPPS